MAQSGALDKLAGSNSDATEGSDLYTDKLSLPEDAISQVVHKTISERIEDGQLDECDLTVRDIARIQEAFVSMLKGIYHPRITYPEPPAVLARAAAVEPVAAEPVAAANGTNGSSATHAANGVSVSTTDAANGARGHLPVSKTVNLESEHGQQQSPANL
jgi:hypothetical protein